MPDEREEIEEVVMEGEMPPANYISMHPEAALTEEEKSLLVNGLETSLGVSGEGREGGEAGEDEEDGDSDD
jgi:hypothetical protein